MRTIERDIWLGPEDLLLPPLSPSLLEVSKGEHEEGKDLDQCDDEKREKQRQERKCQCRQLQLCRHFLTYDLFEVCLALREVHAKRKQLTLLERRSLLLNSSYHDWFMPPFAAWLAVVSEQVKYFIQFQDHKTAEI